MVASGHVSPVAAPRQSYCHGLLVRALLSFVALGPQTSR